MTEHAQQHWESIYTNKPPQQWSWFREHLESSLSWIERTLPERTAPILDVGAGASTLVDDLLARGYRDITVLDISRAALDLSRQRLGGASSAVQWICADILQAPLPTQRYALWHDRALFHFLTQASQRQAYVRQLRQALRPGGHLLISTFSLHGPQQCSGLDVVRYDAASLSAELGPSLRLEQSWMEEHQTPAGRIQPFFAAHFVRVLTSPSGSCASE